MLKKKGDPFPEKSKIVLLSKILYKFPMKKATLLLLLIFLSTAVFSQVLMIEYLVKINRNLEISSTSTKYNLILDKHQSIYYNHKGDSTGQFKYKELITESKKIGNFTLVRLNDEHYALVTQDLFYKNYLEDTLIYNENILTKHLVVGESSKLFSWSIHTDTDTTLLGYRCQKATTEFRGRKYTAYFSPELAPTGGPWKFDGLPGMILYVYSQDDYFIIEPLKIILHARQEAIANPYAGEEVITWNDFKSKLKKVLETQLQKLKAASEPGDTGAVEVTDEIEDLGIGRMSFRK
ncbi:MAG: GLPGLI family protein [Bacteroidia bacterium]|nr:GLPGLI family protein [Bacteroidia bacterium]